MAEVRIHKIVIDIVLLALVFLPVLLVEIFAEPFHRGFYCDDESIKYPFKDDTVSTVLLIFLGVSLPILTVLLVEACLYYQSRNEARRTGNNYFRQRNLRTHSVPPLIYYLYFIIGVFLFGAAVTEVFTQTTKYMVGRLRPYFLTVCQPDYSLFNCSDNYIEVDVCTGDAHLIKEARLSFISGHASFSWYCAVYLALYLEMRFSWKISKLLKPALQVAVLMLALMCTLTRISDYKHHWSDVLGGSILGITVAVLVFTFISDLLKMPLPVERLHEESLEIDYREEEAYILQGDSEPTYYHGV
ncbi:phospholipid phosphatase 2-like [Glandiceps talaboti]